MKLKKLQIILISYNYFIFIYIYIFFILFDYSLEYDCTEAAPFYNKIISDCKDHCQINNIISSLCIPSAEFFSSIEETKTMLEEALKSTSLININYEYIIKGDNVIFQIISTEILKDYVNKVRSTSNTYIDLGECENHLKKANNIPLDDPLIIMFINIINTSYITRFDEGYLAYDPNTKNKLNILDVCNSKNDFVYFNISIDLGSNIDKSNYTILRKKGFNLANKDGPFYKDVCKNFTYDYSSDLPLSYRKKIFNDYILDVCGDNCITIDYYSSNGKVSCKCYATKNIRKKYEKGENIFNKAKLNFNVLKCYKNIIDINFEVVYLNVAFMLFSFLLFLFLILMLIYFLRKNTSFQEIVDNVMNYNRELLKRINYIEGLVDKSEEDEKDKQLSNCYLSRGDPSSLVTRSLLKNSSAKFLIFKNEKNVNVKVKKIKMNEKENQKNMEFNCSTKPHMFNTRVIYEKKIINKVQESPNDYKKKKSFNKQVKFNIKEKNYEKIQVSKYTEYNIVKKLDIIEKDQRLLYYYDTEINLLEYEKALEIETRSLLRYYWSIIVDNNLLLYSFSLWNNDYNFLTVKLSFFIFSFFFVLFVNILFMTDKDIYHLYEAEGKYEFTYYIIKNTISMVICTIIILLMKYLVFGVNIIFSIRYLEKEVFEENVKILIKKIHKKNTIFFLISLIFNIFMWYFGICFCLAYYNNQIILISNVFVTLAEITLYPFLFAIICVIIHHIALNDEKKNRIKLYKFNQYFEFILL